MSYRQVFMVIILCVVWKEIAGTLCYECSNQPSREECLKNGRLTNCHPNEQSCQTEVQFHNGWATGMKITKRCKQRRACVNNYKQNPGICKPSETDSKCFCCCHEDRCNDDVMGCWKDVDAVFPNRGKNKPQRRPRNKCKAFIRASRYGDLECTEDSNVGSICVFYTNNPDKMPNFRRRCVMNQHGVFSWENLAIEGPGEIASDDAGKCFEVLAPMENQRMTCSEASNVGSICEFECVDGYIMDPLMEDDATLECIMDFDSGSPLWSGPPPLCFENVCEPLSNETYHEFLEGWCNDGNKFGSECYFSCFIGFGVTPLDSSMIRCQEGEDGFPVWSSSVPTCEPLSCAPFEVADAIVECSDDFLFDSTCNVACQIDGHVTSPADFTSSTCLPDLTWSHDPPCCVRPCPPNAPMDMVIALDSSSSIRAENWDKVIRFVNKLINYFTVGPNSTNIAVFRYTTKVDRLTEINLHDHDNEQTLREAVEAIPYEGMGTWTGIALGHAANYSLHPSSGNREHYHDVVLVITDGQTNDEDNARKKAKQLREMGTTVLVIGVEPEKLGARFTKDELLSFTGDVKERVFLTHNGFSELEEIHQAVVDTVCRDLCNKSRLGYNSR